MTQAASSGLLHELFHERVAAHPTRPALLHRGAWASYGELWERARAVAGSLVACGVSAGERLILCQEHGPGLVASILGALMRGAVVVPVEPSTSNVALRALTADCGAPLFLVGTSTAKRFRSLGLSVLNVDEEPEAAPCDAAEGLEPTSLAFVFYTSGSTGAPKGVMQTHGQVCEGQLGPMAVYGFGEGDCGVLRTPLSTSGLVCEIFWPLLAGGRLVALEAVRVMDPAYLLSLVLDHGVTFLVVVPSLLRMLVDEPALAACASLRFVCCSGEALDEATGRRFEALLPGRLSIIYGTTETPSTTVRPPGGPAGDYRVVGPPVPGKPVHLLDERGRPVSDGDDGEVHVGGPGVAAGYWGQPGLTAQRFVPDPFAGEPGARMYRTGDLARRLPDGSIRFLGRSDFQLKIRGLRVEPGAIEGLLHEHAAVAEVLVGLRGEAPEQRLVAWVRLTRPLPDAGRRLRALAASRLPPHQVPAVFVVLDEFPRLRNGKVDRSALPDPPREAEVEREVAGSGATDRVLAAFRRVLERPDLGAEDDFFLNGGHSLLALRVTRELSDALGSTVPLEWLFEAPSAALLARRVAWGRCGPLMAPADRVGRELRRFLRRTRARLGELAPSRGDDALLARRDDEGARRLVLLFAGLDHDLMMEPQDFLRTTGAADGAFAVLADRSRGFYQGARAAGLLPWLRTYRDERPWCREVACGGTSAGAYAALLYGHLMAADEVHAFGAPTLLDPSALRAEHRLAASWDVPEGQRDLLPLLMEGEGRTRHHLYYCRDCPQDRWHAERLADCPGVELHPQPGDTHGVVREMHLRGLLDGLLSARPRRLRDRPRRG